MKVYFPILGKPSPGFLVGKKISENVYFVADVVKEEQTIVPDDQTLLGTIDMGNYSNFDISASWKDGHVYIESLNSMIIYYSPNNRYSLGSVLDSNNEATPTEFGKIISRMAEMHHKNNNRGRLDISQWPVVEFFLVGIIELVLMAILLIQLIISSTLYVLTINTPYQYKLSNLTFFGEQLFVRLRFFYKRDGSVSKLRHRDAKYRVFTDVLIGSILAIVILRNDELILSFLKSVLLYFKSILTDHIVWLLGWPGGLKLNDYLDHVFGSLSLGCINWWASLLDSFVGYYALRVLAFSGFFGASFLISLISDFLAFSTSYLFLFYLLFSRIYSVQLSTMLSLWRLFRGLKKNDLRNRIDSYEYTIAQMILGSFFFTLLVFLFPTVAVYYYTFTAFRVIISLLQAFIGILLSLFNLFPLYLIILRLVNPTKVPGGIWFNFIEKRENIVYFKLESKITSWARVLEIDKPMSKVPLPDLFVNAIKMVLTGQILPRDILGLPSGDSPTIAELNSIYKPRWTRFWFLSGTSE